MAAAPSKLGTQFRKDLSCSICLELFTRPKVLPCQHTFCQHCLRDHAWWGPSIQCPKCRLEVRLPPQGVAGLPDNHTVANMCERLQNHEGQDEHPTTSSHHHGNQGQEEHQPQKVTFGGERTGKGRFRSPYSVTVSDEGEIFVVDWGNRRIQVYTLQGTFVRQFPTVVSGEQEIYPNDVAMDGEGNLWVVGRDSAVQYNKQGRVLRKFDLQETWWDRGVAVDTRRNHILITQTTGDFLNPHGEVLVFRPDGTLVRTVGQQQGMKNPVYITVDGEGNILVSDWENSCVYVYNEDGQFLFQFGGEGSGEGQLNRPHGICTDRAGNIIVADWGNDRVEMFDKTGKFLKHITTDMEWPHTVAMATQGQLVVTDHGNHTVSIFHNY